MTQFSLFGAAAADPVLEDLDGVLVAGGQWVRSTGTARLSVVVADRWRADELAQTFEALAVSCDDAIVPANDGVGVRTGFGPALSDHAARWTRGAGFGVPPSFALGPGGLRLWAIATGRRDDTGFLLATPSTARADNPLHQAAGAQLSRLGVAAVSVSHRGGPGWRVTSARRLRRLQELLGPAPAGGDDHWPAPHRRG